MRLFGSLLSVGLYLIYSTWGYARPIAIDAIEDKLTKSAQRLLGDLVNETKETRLPIPDASAVTEARNLIKEAFADEYRLANTRSYSSTGVQSGSEWLIDKLFLTYSEEADPARGYALLIEAKELALDNHAFGLAMTAIDATSARYQQDSTQLRTECLANAFKGCRHSYRAGEKLQQLFDLAIETATRGVGHNSFAAAKNAALLALEIAKSVAPSATQVQEQGKRLEEAERELKNAEVGERAKRRKQKDEAEKILMEARQLQNEHKGKFENAKELAEAISRREKLHHEYTLALQALQVSSDDKRANAVVGHYLCLEVGDWNRGLPFMALGDRSDLAAVAREELRILNEAAEIDPTRDPNDVLALANELWRTAAAMQARVPPDSDGKPHADALRRHAAAIYARISPSLSNRLDRGLAESRADFSVGATEEKRFRRVEWTSFSSDNLLPRCELSKHALAGIWRIVPGGIQSNDAAPAKMKVPFKGDLPEEYDFEIEFTPLSGGLCVGQALSAFGTGFSCDFGGWDNTIVGFQMVDGREGNNNRSTTRQRQWLTARRRHVAVIEVRHDSVSARLDGKLVVTMPTNYRNLKHREDWAFPNDSIGIGSWETPTIFHRASVISR